MKISTYCSNILNKSLLISKSYSIVILLIVGQFTTLCATDYYVSTTGIDDSNRDGLTSATAWASIAYACTTIPAGTHTINIGAGTFTATQTAYPKSGTSLVGAGMDQTIIQASSSWVLTGTPRDFNNDNYIIAATSKENLYFSNMTLKSEDSGFLIDGGMKLWVCNYVEIEQVRFTEFSWAGIYTRGKFFELHDCDFLNASTQRDSYWGGSIFTRYFDDSEVYNNTIHTTYGGGYGYKGSGHRRTKLYNNTITSVNKTFSIESAHENEYDFEIYDNYLQWTISVPKVNQSSNPLNQGYSHTVWIHDNVIRDNYTVEGPRNHMRINNNYIDAVGTGGRIYTQFGGENRGPIWIHNNVILNVDRAFVWKNNGQADSIHIWNNTVYLKDTSVADAVLGIPGGSNLGKVKGWTFCNNVIIAPSTQPRDLYPPNRGGDTAIFAENNLLININNVPPNNYMNEDPGFNESGNKPFPYYAPLSTNSFVVDKGKDVGLPFTGLAPDLGAFESDFVLPVSWLDVRATRQKSNTVLVEWSTASELNNERFVIQRLVVGDIWKEVGTIAGQGSVLTEQHYQFIDKSAPLERLYYRIVQHDFDGQFDKSKIVVVETGGAGDSKLYPTLVRSEQSIQVECSLSTLFIPIAIVDESGKTVLEVPVTNRQIGWNTIRINVAALNSGKYYLKIAGQIPLSFVKMNE